MLNVAQSSVIEKLSCLMGELKNPTVPCSEERVKEILKTIYSSTGLRDLIPLVKEEKPFLKKVHSSPLKNVALSVTQAVKAHQQRLRTGSGKAGWPTFKKKVGFHVEYLRYVQVCPGQGKRILR